MATPAQQRQQCQHNKGSNTSTMRAIMRQCQHDKSRRQRNEGNKSYEVVDAIVECEFNYWRLLLYANCQCIWTAYQCTQTFHKYLRWMGEAVWVGCWPQTWHNHIILTPQPQVTQNPKIWAYSCGLNCVRLLLNAHRQYQCAQTLCICLIPIWEAVWGGCQSQPWYNHIILTPQATQNPQNWVK